MAIQILSPSEVAFLDCSNLDCRACPDSVYFRKKKESQRGLLCRMCRIKLRILKCRKGKGVRNSPVVNKTTDDYVSLEERIQAHQKRVFEDMKRLGILEEHDRYKGKHLREDFL